ncbi:MAG: hypothetical protein IKN26_00600 [Eubacterium sp.]|nr:hypothetical protein [Eubacterium sp.]
MANESSLSQSAQTSNAMQSSDENIISSGQVASDQNSDESINQSTESDDEKSARFNEMISGEYKAEYQSALENVLSKRLKTSNKKLARNEEFRNRIQPIFERLAVKYSIEDSSDIEAIISAAEKDNSYYEEYANKLGVDVDGAKQLLEAKRIIEEKERAIENERLEEEFKSRFEGWLKQAEQTKERYPSFDFEYESTNEKTGEAFRRLLNSGIDVESAYTVIHKNEIMGGAMQYAYKTAKQEMANARTARLNRPDENGISSFQGSAAFDDISKLKPEQRKLIKAAVSRGEKVSAENFRKFL